MADCVIFVCQIYLKGKLFNVQKSKGRCHHVFSSGRIRANANKKIETTGFDGTVRQTSPSISIHLMRETASTSPTFLFFCNVATNAAMFLRSSMRSNASMVLKYCICLFYFGCGSRIYSRHINFQKGLADYSIDPKLIATPRVLRRS